MWGGAGGRAAPALLRHDNLVAELIGNHLATQAVARVGGGVDRVVSVGREVERVVKPETLHPELLGGAQVAEQLPRFSVSAEVPLFFSCLVER